MKKLLLLSALAVAVMAITMSYTNRKKDLSATVSHIGQLYLQRAHALDSFLQTYPTYFYDSSFTTRQRKYEELAWYFKRASGFLLYFEPDLYYEKLISPFSFKKNGGKGFYGVLPDNWLFIGPIGNESDSTLKTSSRQDSIEQRDFIIQAVAHYRQALQQCNYKTHISAVDEPRLFDMLRIEIFRISTIDIANADFIIDDAAIPSLNGALDSWLLFTGELVSALPTSQMRLQQTWEKLSSDTKSYLQKNIQYRSFDRIYFIRQNLIPLSSFLNDLQQALGVPFLKKFAAVRSDARHIYDRNIFNQDYFAPNADAFYSPEKAKLGQLLFFDPLLSDNNRRACASCHKPGMAFTDGLKKSTSFDLGSLPRNSPTVINAGFQKKLFWDTRAGSMEDQLDSVVNNAAELHSSFEHVIDKLDASPEYVSLFHEAFPATRQRGITRADIKHAIGVYERTLTGLNTRFDQYMQGDDAKLDPEEIRGFNVFMGKAKCGVCHTAPLFGSALAPFFDFTTHQSLGVPVKDTMSKYVVDPDIGMMKLDGDAFNKFSFKTPSIRNVALTAPYMHNGVYNTLEQVVNFYDHAAGNKFYLDMKIDMTGLPFFTVLPIPLQLSDKEKKDLVSFLKCLTDTSSTTAIPTHLPRLKGNYADVNRRRIGGEY